MEVKAILGRLREICLALPGATEKIAWGEPTWRAGRIFAMFSNHHHGDEHVSVWCNAAEGAQEALIAADPRHFYRPPYVGPGGWIGIRLDTGLDWNVVASLVRDAYRLTAPKKLVRQLDEASRARFAATLLDGHKGLAFELPLDPGQRIVSGTINGVPFDSIVVRRLKKLWVLVDDDLAAGAGAGVGDVVTVVLELAAAVKAPAAAAPRRARSGRSAR